MPRRAPRTSGFVLLEVLLSLMILGIAVAAFMRSFTQSLAAAKRIEVQSQAALLARKLMDQMEMTPPADGSSDGDFGTNYPAYTYRVTMEYEEPNYGKLDGDDGIEQYYAMRQVEIEAELYELLKSKRTRRTDDKNATTKATTGGLHLDGSDGGIDDFRRDDGGAGNRDPHQRAGLACGACLERSGAIRARDSGCHHA
jgi:type II secretion system protein I